MREDLRAAFRSFGSSKTFTVVALAGPDARHWRDDGDLLSRRRRRAARRCRSTSTTGWSRWGSAARRGRDWIRTAIRCRSRAPRRRTTWTGRRSSRSSSRSQPSRAARSRFASLAPSPKICARSASLRTSSTCFECSPRLDARFTADERSRRPSPRRGPERRSVAAALRRRSRDRRTHRFRSKGVATRSSASCRPDFTYPVGATRPTDLWVPVRRSSQTSEFGIHRGA